MNSLLKSSNDKRYLKLKGLAKKQSDVLNKLLLKHNNIVTEKDQIIEMQYNIIQDQSKNIESLLYQLDKTYNKKTLFQRIKSFVRVEEPVLSV
jgi:hypothetical protein